MKYLTDEAANEILRTEEWCKFSDAREMIKNVYAMGYAAAVPAPVVREPLTDEQLAKIAVEDEFLLYCDQDSFNEIARAIEQAHGIGTTGGGK